MKVPIILTELLKRFVTKNPIWAKRIQVASLVVGALAWLPELFQFLEIPQSAWMEVLHNKFVKIGTLLALIIAQLPNENKAQDEEPENGLTVGGRPNDRNP